VDRPAANLAIVESPDKECSLLFFLQILCLAFDVLTFSRPFCSQFLRVRGINDRTGVLLTSLAYGVAIDWLAACCYFLESRPWFHLIYSYGCFLECMSVFHVYL